MSLSWHIDCADYRVCGTYIYMYIQYVHIIATINTYNYFLDDEIPPNTVLIKTSFKLLLLLFLLLLFQNRFFGSYYKSIKLVHTLTYFIYECVYVAKNYISVKQKKSLKTVDTAYFNSDIYVKCLTKQFITAEKYFKITEPN